MPSYTSPAALTLGWDLHSYSHRYDRYVKAASHRIERREAKLTLGADEIGAEPFDFLARIDHEQALADLRAETFFDTIEEVNTYLEQEDMLDTLEEAKLVLSLGAFSPYERGDFEHDEDDDAEDFDLDEGAWGTTFDPADIQWGFSVRTKDSGRW